MKLLRATFASFVLLTLLTGVVFPLVITAIAKVVFPHQADGSLIDKNGNPTTDDSAAIGSSLIGQTFNQPAYFWSRPSKTSPMPYNATASSGSNTGPSAIAADVQARAEILRNADPTNTTPLPIDLVTASASGLDPQESIAAAQYQISRIAKIRNVDPAKLHALIEGHTRGRDLGILGEKTINVLELNIALDKLTPYQPPATAPATQLK